MGEEKTRSPQDTRERWGTTGLKGLCTRCLSQQPPSLRAGAKAAALSLWAYTLWTFVDTLSKLAAATLPVFERCVFSLGTAALFLACVALVQTHGRSLVTKKPFFHLLRGLIAAGGVATLNYAIAHMPLANFFALSFTSPFLMAVISRVFLKEKISWGVWGAIGVGFVGVIIAIDLSAYDPAAWGTAPVMATLISNFCFIFYVLTVKSGGQDESSIALAFYPALVTALVLGGLLSLSRSWVLDEQGILLCSGAGLLNGAAWLAIVSAYRFASNSFVASFIYFQIVIGALIGFLFWGDVPTLSLLAGSVLIIGAGLYVLWRGPQEEPSL